MGRATVFEEHASVLPRWWSDGIRGATLICVDAHLDLQFIAPERIERLRACGTLQEMQALESPHPLSPERDGSCYGIEDFLYAAAQLGVVRRLVWVAPPHVLADLHAALAALRQMEGVTQAQLDSFAPTPGGWFEGDLLGLRIALLEWQQLPAVHLEGPVLADIDADFFVQVPQDHVWMQPRDLLAALRGVLGADADITIARSVGTGFLPLRHRFLADLLAASWEGRDADAAHWQALLDIELSPPAPEVRAARLRQLLAVRPDCAATTHALAQAVATAEDRRALLARAARLDASYAGDLLRRLGTLRVHAEGIDLATVKRLQRHLETLQDSPQRLGASWVALGLFYTAFGRLDEAIACDDRSRRHGGGHPDLALQIGRLEMARGRIGPARPWLQRAADDDETRAAAWLHLSVCASRTGDRAEATQLASRVHAACPAWPEAAHWLRSLEASRPPGAAPSAVRLGATCP
jgi:hypothetical protein